MRSYPCPLFLKSRIVILRERTFFSIYFMDTFLEVYRYQLHLPTEHELEVELKREIRELKDRFEQSQTEQTNLEE